MRSRALSKIYGGIFILISMKKICGIYKITSPTGKVYIGQSIDICSRLKQYQVKDCKKQPKLFSSLIKYGYENHSVEIIEHCTVDFLNERERYWQDFYNCSKIGLNCRLTKTNDKSGTISKETKEKLRNLYKGKKRSEESIQKQKKTWEHNKSINKKQIYSKEGLERKSKLMKIPIIQYSLNGEFIKEWESAKDVEDLLFMKRTHIRACCRGKRKTAGGFVWKNKI